MLSNIIDRIRLPFRKEKEFYFALRDVLGFLPHNITYYKVALMHKSLGHRATPEELKALEGKEKKKQKATGKEQDSHYANLNRKKGKKQAQADEKQKGGRKGQLGRQINNERLEFLGDAILDAVVGDVVYHHFPGKPEGFLTNTRSKLVQRETLGRLAKEMGINKLVLSSARTATHNSYMGGNAFEALVGAIYLDKGYEACYDFWTKRIMRKYLNVDKMAYKEVNFKSKILEWTQKNRIKLEFRLEDQSQDRHGSPKFVYSLCLEGLTVGTAEGFSKKESQQKACEITLKKLRSDNKFLDRIFAAKTERTKMEETPTALVPVIEDGKSDDLFIKAEGNSGGEARQTADDSTTPTVADKAEKAVDELTFDDIAAEPGKESYEDIIAKAEAAAYEKAE